MLITAIQIKRIYNSGTKMRGVASVTLDDMIVIHDIKILEANGKFFLAMPSKQTKSGTFKDSVHPINAEVRTAFETLIIGGYEKTEKENYSKIELVCMDREKEKLTEQSLEEFSVQGMEREWNPILSRIHAAEGKTDVSKLAEDKIDDNLIKWLER